ncbi:hypothetical protein M9H77_36492 [Catharanthus roseus]|uniref:Uncharacterized protein n=1 Tax=Catharanthus roseus TaxID=4058 RepID=A0ACB9ZU55_CATRO|nr:hypothetical protein M9H77_36492 [Catharanthus roseus]
MLLPFHHLFNIYQEGALVSGSSGTSLSSSYSLWDIFPEKDPIPISDLSDSETIEEPVGQQVEAARQQIVELREEISRMDALFLGPARHIDRFRSWTGLGSLSPSSFILLGMQWIEPAPSWSPGKEVLVANTLRQSRPRIRDETFWLFKNMSNSRPSNQADEAMFENSQSRQPEPIRENTPCPEQATYMVMENFMIRMTELLETSMTTRRNELRGIAKHWWLRASKAQALKNQPSTWNNFQEKFRKECILRGATEERNDKPQVKAKVYTLDGLAVDTEAKVVEGDFLRACDNSRRSNSGTSKGRAVTNWTQPKIPIEVHVFLGMEGGTGYHNVDDLDSGEWIHLKRGVVPWRAWPNRSTWTPQHSLQWDGRLVESQEWLETKVGPRADLIEMLKFDSDDLVVGSRPCPSSPTVALCISLHSGVEAALMCLDSLRLPICTQNPHVSSSISFVKITKESVLLVPCMNCFREIA